MMTDWHTLFTEVIDRMTTSANILLEDGCRIQIERDGVDTFSVSLEADGLPLAGVWHCSKDAAITFCEWCTTDEDEQTKTKKKEETRERRKRRKRRRKRKK